MEAEPQPSGNQEFSRWAVHYKFMIGPAAGTLSINTASKRQMFMEALEEMQPAITIDKDAGRWVAITLSLHHTQEGAPIEGFVKTLAAFEKLGFTRIALMDAGMTDIGVDGNQSNPILDVTAPLMQLEADLQAFKQ